MACKQRILHIFILSVSLISCSAAACAAVMSMSLYFKKINVNVNEFGNYLPHHYAVKQMYDTGIRDQYERQMSAVFSMISLLEGEYRSRMIVNNELQENKTIEFSEQAFSAIIKKLCTTNKQNPVCKSLNPFTLEGISISQLIKLIQAFPSTLGGSLFPKSTCPFLDSTSKDPYQCNATLNYASNPIKFTIKNLKWSDEIHGIKELLYSSMKPILFTMPQLLAEYYIPCDDPRANETLECAAKTFDCPYNPTKKCGILQFPSHTLSGEYFIPNEPVGVAVGTPINFEIVGYSDWFVPTRGRMSLKQMKMSQGGFIAKGPDRDIGFPITVFTGDLKKSSAHGLCPNARASHFWYGPLRSCMKKGPDVVECSAMDNDDEYDTEKSFESADVLQCIDMNYCKEGARYSILHMPSRTYDTMVYEDKESGMTKTPMILLKKESVEDVVYDHVPFYLLGNIFDKMGADEADRSCGYWFIPYDVIEKVKSVTKDGEVLGFSFDVDFDKSSLLSKIPDGQFKRQLKITNAPNRVISRLFKKHN
ncbi:hypothetical protein TVAG_160090 [Trichomonas vaginalis G3]|uniref:Uncharacterized protein n=1 Tax=Trichomonas vaginalis (strain ATCC PRA-98 / G3) TaxID=412133 RepID=A2DUV1_TRIV3|nr:papain family cysteine protease domain containing protein family [Trichomonas vaginalis G3]EAY15836.1 hypothetical protein TVAG_160090 [Trichomonas vaginalis G3]KAI5524995.1 papain family cysteine protease domain containing protein family [Trichomonas vaginalis G3]|eukprot:XP_001328059.1 hypothetical protein [Trichomonas vaginalis G3]